MTAIDQPFPWRVTHDRAHIAADDEILCGIPYGSTSAAQPGIQRPLCPHCLSAFWPLADPAVMRVGKDTPTEALAHSVVKVVRQQYRDGFVIDVSLRAMAPIAVSTAVKAIAVARGMLTTQGIDNLVIIPSFDTVPGRTADGDGKVSVMVMRVVQC